MRVCEPPLLLNTACYCCFAPQRSPLPPGREDYHRRDKPDDAALTHRHTIDVPERCECVGEAGIGNCLRGRVMTGRMPIRVVSILLAVAVGVATGCSSTDIAGATDAENSAVAVSQAGAPMIDVARGVIVNRKTGKSFAMPADMAELYLQTVEAQQKMAVLEKRFDTDSRIKALKASGLRFDRATSRAMRERTLGRSPAPSGQADLNAPAPSAADLCGDISISIYASTVEYRETLGDQGAALALMDESWQAGNIAGFIAGYVEWRSASIDIIFLQVDLSILSPMYGAYGCWN